MYITAFITILAIIFASYAGFIKNDKFLLFSFAIIFCFIAFRYDFGLDYMAYYDAFEEIKELEFSDLHEASLQEIGYVFSNWIFARLGLNFFDFIIVVTFLQSMVLYKLVQKYVPCEYYWLSIAIFMFCPTMMLMNCTAIRQSIAIYIFLFSLKYIMNKSFLKFLACILIGCLFHKSCFFMMPMFFICQPYKINKTVGIIFICSFLVCLLFGSFVFEKLAPLINYIYPYYLLKYTYSGQFGSGLTIVFNFFCLIWYLRMLNEQDKEMNVLMKVSIIYFVTLGLGITLNMFARIGYYFLISLTITVPYLISKFEKSEYKIIACTLFVTLYLVTFYRFFSQAELSLRGAEKYQTIFYYNPN